MRKGIVNTVDTVLEEGLEQQLREVIEDAAARIAIDATTAHPRGSSTWIEERTADTQVAVYERQQPAGYHQLWGPFFRRTPGR